MVERQGCRLDSSGPNCAQMKVGFPTVIDTRYALPSSNVPEKIVSDGIVTVDVNWIGAGRAPAARTPSHSWPEAGRTACAMAVSSASVASAATTIKRSPSCHTTTLPMRWVSMIAPGLPCTVTSGPLPR